MDIDKIIWIPIITALITLAFNVIFHVLKNNFDWFVDKKKFKREHAYKQLTNLYLELYGVIAQSEYIRYFLEKQTNTKISIYEYPFFEIKKSTKNIKSDFLKQSVEVKSTLVEDGITEFNKRKIDSTIIEKSQFASGELLKLAIAHRYCEDNYQKKITDENVLNQFLDEELELIGKIVRLIIKETNELLEICHMDYDGKEISYGVLNMDVIEKESHI